MSIKDTEVYEINTHQLYDTVSHEHLDNLVSFVTGKYPESGLMLVECKNGNWYVEIDYGHDYDSFQGISKPKVIPYLEPNFYPDSKAALSYALVLMKKIHPQMDEKKYQIILMRLISYSRVAALQ